MSSSSEAIKGLAGGTFHPRQTVSIRIVNPSAVAPTKRVHVSRPVGSSATNVTLVAPLGQGTGFYGLPGDTSPASRFVRGAAFVATHVEVADGPALEAAMLHVMNSFDIPKGSVVTTDGTSIEHTQFTSISNLRDLHYVVRTEQNFTPYRIDVKAVDLSPGPVRQLDFPSGDFAELTI